MMLELVEARFVLTDVDGSWTNGVCEGLQWKASCYQMDAP